MSGINRTLKAQSGITYTELIIALFILCLIISTLIPSYIQIRERHHKWNAEIALEQEALRFFTYLENRNANILKLNVHGNNLEVFAEVEGKSTKRTIYKSGTRIMETPGTIIISHHVEYVKFTLNSDRTIAEINLTLSKNGFRKTYVGYLVKGFGL